ncbi:hypothetical protein, partial [Neisseria meningitidis]|uniref:hypothetical protein n=1 Tax=Neisseria meningitidis TaxID=487 RepID=UPI001C915D15
AISDTFPHASIPSFLRFQSFPITPWFFISRFPACAGMTAEGLPFFPVNTCNLKSHHCRENKPKT